MAGDILEVVSPCRPGTTAGRLLEKRGDGSYMIIMQNRDDLKRRKLIEEMGFAKVISSHNMHGYHYIQYHPKGIKGGMMPELASVDASAEHPNQLDERFSPRGPCVADFAEYSEGMRKSWDFNLVGVLLRLETEDVDTEGAARHWVEIFGVCASGDVLTFTNVRMDLV